MAVTVDGPINTPTGVTYTVWRRGAFVGRIDRDTHCGAFRYTVTRPVPGPYDFTTGPTMAPAGRPMLTLTNAIQALDLLTED